jgi:hypothetical protein
MVRNAMKKGLPRWQAPACSVGVTERRPEFNVARWFGSDLSRKRLDFCLLDDEGATVEVGASPPDADGLRGLSERLGRHGMPIRAAIESMNGARFVHDRLELAG